MDRVLVNCKYLRKCDQALFKDIDCVNKFGRVHCNQPFYIDWVKFILYRKHLIEVKE